MRLAGGERRGERGLLELEASCDFAVCARPSQAEIDEPPMPPAATPYAPMLIRRCAVASPSTKSCALLWFLTKIFSCHVTSRRRGEGASSSATPVPAGSVLVCVV